MYKVTITCLCFSVFTYASRLGLYISTNQFSSRVYRVGRLHVQCFDITEDNIRSIIDKPVHLVDDDAGQSPHHVNLDGKVEDFHRVLREKYILSVFFESPKGD